MLAERLKHARNSLGLTLQRVSELTEIGLSTLSDYENANREPKFSVLKKLADIYRRPVSFFLDDGPIQPFVVLWLHKPDSPVAEELRARFEMLAEQYHNLEIWCGEHGRRDLPFASEPHAAEFQPLHAARLAGKFRRGFGLGDQPGQSLLSVLEETCKVKVFHLAFEPAGGVACCRSDRFGAAVLLNANSARRQRNVDLARALFHLLTWPVFRVEAAEDEIEVTEAEGALAAGFARHLLMPEEPSREAADELTVPAGALRFADVFEIARKFDVSVEAVLERLSDINRISAEEVPALIERWFNEMCYWDSREQDAPLARPLRFRVLATDALRRGAISAGRFAEYVGVSRREAMEIVARGAEEDAEVETAHS